jgi:spermidine/putrescine transport system permease protein
MSDEKSLNNPVSLKEGRGATEKKITGIPRKSQLALLVAPSVIWLIILLVLPLITMVTLSFQKSAFGADSEVFTFASYINFWQNSAYQSLLVKSLWISLAVAVLSILLAYPVAYFLAFHAGDKQGLLLNIMIIPAWTSFLLRVLAWRLILGSNGLLNTFLMWLGVIQEPISGLFYSVNAVVITLVYIWIPFAALPIYVALLRIEPGLLEAASDLGARPWQGFLKVTLPLSIPGVLASFLYVFIPTVGEYVTPALVGGPNGLMIGNIIWDQFMRGLDWPMGATLSLMVMLIVILPLVLMAKAAQQTGILGGKSG